MSTVSYNGNEYTESQFREAVTVLEQQKNVQIEHRDDYIRELGDQYQGDRDIYEVLGYPENEITSTQYRAKFERQDIARRIVELPARDAWKESPDVSDALDSETETEFDKQLERIKKNVRLWNTLYRLDIATGIGEYGVLFFGLADGQDFSEPVASLNSPSDLKYLMPFSQDRVMEWTLGKEKEGIEKSHPRYNKPVEYTLNFADPDEDVTDQEHWEDVHWERCVHVAEGKIASELKGTPRLQPVYNRLDDLEKVLGSSAEMFWSGADEKYHLNIDTDDTQRIDSDALDQLDTEVKKLVHDMEKAIKTFNTDLEVIGGQEVNPEGVVTELLKFISGATGIPKRILTGSEQGELASSQDKANWFRTVSSRQDRFVIPEIVRPVIERLQQFGVLKSVEIEIEWPNLFELTKQEEASIWEKRANAISTLSKGKSFASAEDLFEFMKEGNTPDFEETEPMQPIPKDTMQEEFERGQQGAVGVEQGQEDGEQGEGNTQQPSENNNRILYDNVGYVRSDVEDIVDSGNEDRNRKKAFGIGILSQIESGRSRNLLKELLNRIKVRNEVLAGNWDAAKHPRDPETGKFVERPYDVPDEISGMETEDIVRQLVQDVPDFAEKMENATIDMDGDMQELIQEETGADSSISGGSTVQAKFVGNEPFYTLDEDTSDIDARYEDIEGEVRDETNNFLNNGIDNSVRHEQDADLTRENYDVIKDEVSRSSNGRGELQIRDNAGKGTYDHEYAHQFMQTFGFESETLAIARAGTGEYKTDGGISREETYAGNLSKDDHKFNRHNVSSPLSEPIESRDDIEEGDVLQIPEMGSTTEVEVLDVGDDGRIWFEGGMIMPDDDLSRYSKRQDPPDRIVELADATDEAWADANETYLETDDVGEAAMRIGGQKYGVSNAHETFATMHEAMQNPVGATSDPGLIAQNQPDWVRAYSKNFKVPRGTREAIKRQNVELYRELKE